MLKLLKIKGFGPKKIKQLWSELGTETPGELLYAIQENRLLALKGFGQKSQDELQKQILFLLHHKNTIITQTQLLDILKKMKVGLTQTII
jgi:DNA polymerase (family 10)